MLRWLDALPRKVQYKWEARFELLEQFGFELRRPVCDYLRNDIYELRLRNVTVQYRVLYAFVGKNAVLLSHGCSKEGKVPEAEIKRAIINLNNYLINPAIHTFKFEAKDETK